MRDHRHTTTSGINTAILAPIRRDREDMTFLWILLGILYVACWIYFGLATFKKGHYWLFWIGFFFPILWIIEALMGPTERAAARVAAGGA
jgi:ABC-type multidrug transport system permease subunit